MLTRVRRLRLQFYRLPRPSEGGLLLLDGLVLFGVVGVVVYQYVAPRNPSERTSLIQLFATIVGGLLLLYGVYQTHKRDRVAEQGHITDRFTKAIDQLGSDKLEIRVGAIHALGRIAVDSPRDYWPIMDTLTTVIRLRAPSLGDQNRSQSELWRDPDVDVALQVVWRAVPPKGERGRVDLSQTNLYRANLSGAHFRWAYLPAADLTEALVRRGDLRNAVMMHVRAIQTDLAEAHLEGAQLIGVQLLGANLSKAHLQRANLGHAQMSGAWLVETELEGATLEGATLGASVMYEVIRDGAHLTRANLKGANLRGAKLGGGEFQGELMPGADFTDANLEGADLRGATGLTWEQLQGANLKNAILPDYL